MVNALKVQALINWLISGAPPQSNYDETIAELGRRLFDAGVEADVSPPYRPSHSWSGFGAGGRSGRPRTFPGRLQEALGSPGTDPSRRTNLGRPATYNMPFLVGRRLPLRPSRS